MTLIEIYFKLFSETGLETSSLINPSDAFCICEIDEIPFACLPGNHSMTPHGLAFFNLKSEAWGFKVQRNLQSSAVVRTRYLNLENHIWHMGRKTSLHIIEVWHKYWPNIPKAF